MNKILELKGTFQHRQKETGYSSPSFPKKENKKVDLTKLNKLIKDLVFISKFWNENTVIKGALVQVNYDRVLAKTHRIVRLLSDGSSFDMNKKIVGAKYRINDKMKHSIVYYIDRKTIDSTIDDIKKCVKILKTNFHSSINRLQLNSIKSKDVRLMSLMSKTAFVNIIVDSYFVESFSLPDAPEKSVKDTILTSFYNIDIDLKDIFRNLDLIFDSYPEKIDDNTFILTNRQYNDIVDKAPYIISMELENISDIEISETKSIKAKEPSIPKPSNEPTIGVIDWPFNKKVYFSDWVDYRNETGLGEEYLIPEDMLHGTKVDSIIVDGPINNPDLDDGCGRFRVRHFGIVYERRANTGTILKKIKKVVEENKDIKVWNLSIGSMNEINENYISPIASELDKIQYENDMIFIVAGTNDEEKTLKKRIGDPADSINSLVVNSVSTKNKGIANYSRKGPVLSFYEKPDVCYYGGTDEKPLVVWDGINKSEGIGTSFAAPWIARKIAFLIHKMGLSKEIAKAIIIDSTLSWNKNDINTNFCGHGIVPIKIDEILSTKEDEIKFYINETATLFNNFSYEIPVPLDNSSFPYVSRATLCYFSKCSRNQGVDYNDIELDLHFGIMTPDGIKTINDNKQNVEGDGYCDEETARKYFRKWDNVKIVSEKYSARKESKPSSGKNDSWALSIKKTGRFREPNCDSINYGVVITLKEINGINRIQEFLRLCHNKGWLYNFLDIDNMNNIYANSEEKIELE